MTFTLVFLALSLLMVPVVETLWAPAWAWLAARGPEPDQRLRQLQLRMASGLALAAGLASAVMAKVHLSPRAWLFAPGGLTTCGGHSLERGPGAFTLGFLALSGLALGLVLVALFYPVPGLPPGRRRADLVRRLAARGVDAQVEEVPADTPACVSQRTPHPRVILAGGVADLLDDAQLAAALDHEAAHLALGDHQARTWARAYRRLLFFFPGAAALFDDFVHEQERRADDQAVAWDPAQRNHLADALGRLATHDPADEVPTPGTLSAMGQAAWSVQQRLARLRGRPEAPPRRAAVSPGPLLAVAALLGVVSTDLGACAVHCLVVSLP